MNDEQLRVGSLFSGIGGLDLGLERAGMRVVWQCEANEWCRRILAKRWPGVPCYADVRDITADAPAVDVLCGGFPCQPVSFAGKGLAQADERWLWPEVARLVRALRPRVLIVENVPGLLAQGMGDVLGDLAACGYDAEWDCIPAAAVGAPHRRDRVFITARPHEVAHAASNAVAGAKSHGVHPQERIHKPGERSCFGGSRNDWWEVEPGVGRVADGVPARVDRLRGLGNAVVPQVAEHIGRRVMETLNAAA